MNIVDVADADAIRSSLDQPWNEILRGERLEFIICPLCAAVVVPGESTRHQHKELHIVTAQRLAWLEAKLKKQ